MKLAVLGLGSRGLDAYVRNIAKYEDVEFSAICDTNSATLEYTKKTYANNAVLYKTDTEFFAAGKLADWLIIATLDKDHCRHLRQAIKLGYNIMVEKPITDSNEELDEILALAKEHASRIIVCHVLRYAPFFVKIKEIIDSGVLGDIISLVHEEGIGFWHFAHSYVRGNWRNTEIAAPILLAKNCHDFDLIYWYLGKECQTVASFGNLLHFTKENKPDGSPARCLDGCPHKETCPYHVEKIYLQSEQFNRWAGPIVTGLAQPSLADTRHALETDSKYGRCVYSCDNNVYDHQIVSMQFEDGITASFTMSAFTPNVDRRIHIVGTKGDLCGVDTTNELVFTPFGEKPQAIVVDPNGEGHLGGDPGICATLHKLMREEHVDKNQLTTIEITAKSHKIVYAAMEAVKSGKTISIK